MTDEVKKPKRSATDRIKEKLLGAKATEEWVQFEENGEIEEYLLVAPTVRQAHAIIQRAMTMPKGKELDEVKAADVSIDNAEVQVQALIACLRDPETKAPVFQQTEREALLDGPLSPLFAKLGMRAAQMVNPSSKKQKKSSEETPT